MIRGLDVRPDGRIWTAGGNRIGWFEPGAQGRLEYHSLMARLPDGAADPGDVWRVHAASNDSALFVARERVLRWTGSRFKPKCQYHTFLPAAFFSALGP